MTEAETSSPQNPVRLGLLGLNFGAGMARHLAKLPFLELRGVCDVDKEKALGLAGELRVHTYESLDLMLDDPAVEAVALFTGPVGRAKLIGRIIDSGRHVLTTKPFELDPIECEKVLDQARNRGLIIHLNSPGPSPAQDIAKIQQWVVEHDLGRPLGFRAETWANYREKANGTWYDDPAKCFVAPILRLGVYFLNEFAAIFGQPKSVQVMESRIFTERPTSDHAQLSIAYQNGALGFIFSSFCIDDGQPYRDHVTLNFERGTIRRWVHRENPHADLSADTARLELQMKGRSPLSFNTSPGAFAGWYQLEKFAQAVRSGSGLSSEETRNIQFGVNLLGALQIASATGQPAPVRPLLT
jgi:predicted dehydrogenase